MNDAPNHFPLPTRARHLKTFGKNAMQMNDSVDSLVGDHVVAVAEARAEKEKFRWAVAALWPVLLLVSGLMAEVTSVWLHRSSPDKEVVGVVGVALAPIVLFGIWRERRLQFEVRYLQKQIELIRVVQAKNLPNQMPESMPPPITPAAGQP
jgi:hypothetical protein